MEAWIRAKYEHREFLPPLPYPEAPLQQQLIDAIARQDTRQVILCLARATPETVNAPYSRQDPRAAIHIAATLGSIVYLQLLLWVGFAVISSNIYIYILPFFSTTIFSRQTLFCTFLWFLLPSILVVIVNYAADQSVLLKVTLISD